MKVSCRLLYLKVKLKEQFMRKSRHELAVGIRDNDIHIFLNGDVLLNAS